MGILLGTKYFCGFRTYVSCLTLNAERLTHDQERLALVVLRFAPTITVAAQWWNLTTLPREWAILNLALAKRRVKSAISLRTNATLPLQPVF